jgi:hypothetical protein
MPDVPGRARAGEGSENNELPSHAGAECEDLVSVEVVAMCFGPKEPDRALHVLDLGGKRELRRKPVVQAGDGIAGGQQCVEEHRVQICLCARGHAEVSAAPDLPDDLLALGLVS